jgi:hypothetical protein
MWSRTVWTERKRVAAMSAVDVPLAMWRVISCSRGVSW